MASLKEFMANISGASADIKNKIIRVIGKTVWEDEPSIDLEKTSTQITAITGESGPLVLPQISLKVVDTHIKKVVGGGTTLYGITDWGSAPASLGSSAATGSATTIARGDHVHPYPTPAQIGAMATNHAANSITGFGTTAQNLNTTGSGGSATTVSRSDHVHQFPTASQVGALASNHPSAAITGLSVDTPQPLDVTPHPGNATTVSRSNHIHAMPTAAQVGAMATNHAANSITGFGTTVTPVGSTGAIGQATTVSRSDHVHAGIFIEAGTETTVGSSSLSSNFSQPSGFSRAVSVSKTTTVIVFVWVQAVATRFSGSTAQFGTEVRVRKGTSTIISPALFAGYFSGGDSSVTNSIGGSTSWWYIDSISLNTTYAVDARFVNGSSSAQIVSGKIQIIKLD